MQYGQKELVVLLMVKTLVMTSMPLVTKLRGLPECYAPMGSGEIENVFLLESMLNFAKRISYESIQNYVRHCSADFLSASSIVRIFRKSTFARTTSSMENNMNNIKAFLTKPDSPSLAGHLPAGSTCWGLFSIGAWS